MTYRDADPVRVLREQRRDAAEVLDFRDVKAPFRHAGFHRSDIVRARNAESEMIHPGPMPFIIARSGLCLVQLDDEAPRAARVAVFQDDEIKEREQRGVIGGAPFKRRGRQNKVVGTGGGGHGAISDPRSSPQRLVRRGDRQGLLLRP